MANIDPSKLVGSSSFISSRISTGVMVPKKNLLIIKHQVIEVKNLLQTSTLLKQAELNKQRKQLERERFQKEEDKLEAKKTQPETEKIKVPGLPKLGFLDRIKNFIITVLLGRFVVKMLPQASKLVDVVKGIGSAIDFASDLTIGLINGFSTFVDKGYKAYDTTRGFLKNIGGDNTLKLFDGFTKAIDATIIAAIALAQMPDPFGGGPDIKRGFDKFGRRATQQAQERYLERYGEKQFAERFGQKALQRATAKGTENVIEKGALRSIVGEIPIIGGLIDFALNYFVFKEPVGEAAFRAAGSTLVSVLGGAIGSLFPGPGTIVGAALGGAAGDAVASMLYDMIFRNKKPSPPKTVKAAGGGTPPTRGGKFVSGPTRKGVTKKVQRKVAAKVSQLKPGADIGGEDKVAKVFPTPEQKDKSKQVDTLGYIKSSYKKITSSKAFGGLMALPLKTLAGQTPTPLDYKVAAQGLNYWLNSTFDLGKAGFAGGGEVNTARFLGGEDMTDVIAKSLQDSVSSQLDDTLNDLMQQLMLKGIETKKDTTPAAPTDGEVTGLQGSAKEFYDYLVSKGLSPNNAVGIALNAARETGFNYGDQHIDKNGLPVGGVLQWNGDRFTGLQKEVPDWKTNWKGQLDYALKENNISKQYLTMKFNSPLDAANWWMEKWERPLNPAADELKHKQIYDQWVAQGMKQGQGPPATLGSMPGNLSSAQQLASQYGLTMTSFNTGEHAKGSLHYQKRAMDFSNGIDTPEQRAFANAIISKYGTSIAELIYTPLGFGIKNGKQVGLDYWGDAVNKQHHNHVHVAFFGGGSTGKGGLTMTHPGEYIIDKDSVDAFGINFFDIVNKVENMSQRQQAAKQLMGILQLYAGYEGGGRQKIKVKVPAPQVVTVPMPIPVGGGSVMTASSSGSRPQDITYRG